MHTMAAPLYPTIRTTSPNKAREEYEDLVAEWGSYSSLLEKAERETLTADEWAQLRRMRNLRFLMNEAA